MNMNGRIFALGCALWLGLSPAHAQEPALALELREVETSYPADAVVEAVRQATVAAQVPGRVVDVRVDAGAQVRQGELLMRLDAREASEGLAAARAQLAQSEANFARTKNLHAQKFVSGAALDKAEAELKAARAAAGQAGAGLSHAAVTAPISGIVAQRHAELGEMASPGRPLITVFDPKGLRLVAQIPQARLAELRRTGNAPTLSARVEFPEANRWIEAARVEVLPTADLRAHTVAARVYLPDGTEGVIPGMAARVHFVTGAAKKLTVPAKAVVRRGDVSAVYVLDAQGKPALRQVRLGEPVAGGDLEVLAGLSAGERVSLDPIATGIRLRRDASK